MVSESSPTISAPEEKETTLPIQLLGPQSKILASQLLHPESPHHNMAFLFLIEGPLELENFHRAWRSVRECNPVLQTVFDSNSQPYLAKAAAGQESLSLDFSASPSKISNLSAWASKRCQVPCNIEESLVDSVVIRLGPSQFAWYLNLHHIITDAATTDFLLTQMGENYCRLIASKNLKNEPRPSYYGTSYKQPSRENAHWKKRQEHLRRTVSFPEQAARSSTTANERTVIKLTKEENQRFNEICSQDAFVSFSPSISRFVALSSLLAGFLHRINNRHEIGFDAPSHGRFTPETKNTSGVFIEVLPFAADIKSGDSFRSLARRCMQETLSFLQNLDSITETAEASAGNIILNYFDNDLSQFGNFSCETEWLHPGHADCIHDLRFQANHFNANQSLQIFLDFNEETFSSGARCDAALRFKKLLKAFLSDPDQEIGCVDVLCENERRRFLTEFNRPSGHPLPKRSLIETISRQAEKTPNGIALREFNRELTYHELHERLENLAGNLREAGIEAKQPVVIGMKRSLESILAILAVWKCGAYYIPIPPNLPTERVQTILADSEAKYLLTRSLDAPLFASVKIETLFVEDFAGDASGDSLPWPLLSDRAYLLYTSGSTGTPKGVPIEHGGVADYIEWAARSYLTRETTNFPFFTSLSFDLTVTSLFLPLTTGGTLHVYPEKDGPADTAVLDVIQENRVDFIKLTPSHLALLRQLDLGENRIRCLVVGGEDFPSALARTVHEQLSGRARIFNEYGPTEAVVGCMIHEYSLETDISASVPIGVPADHCEIYVLNDSLQPVPPGVAGELCIARYGLSSGYHKRPDLTEKHFVPHPFRSGDMLYRSGDLACFLPNGILHCLGRIDRQVKLSGHRIELGEIENSLQTHPDIEQCVVALKQTRVSFQEPAKSCIRCGLPSNLPGASFNSEQVCQTCEHFDLIKNEAAAYFKPFSALQKTFSESRKDNNPEYDCISLLSGGKDSTYMLARLVDLGLRVYAFTLDNDYLSEHAKDNIRRVTEKLGVPHEFATTPAMNAIFRDSLNRFSNVCNGCFKTVYTLAVNRALELKIPYIATGLSRGQFFETRLTADIFKEKFLPEEVDQAVLAARKAYHSLEDEVSRSLNVAAFNDPEVFQKVRFIDFYRYCDVSLAEMMSFLADKVGWVRPSDTGRSTNCLINDAGIYIHKKERGYHNYALPYSWDVRMGHKTREEALQELDDQLDTAQIQRMLTEIGYDEHRLEELQNQKLLVAYYTSPAQIDPKSLTRYLSSRLPQASIPSHYVNLEKVPLTPNGKIDFEALPNPKSNLADESAFTPPDGAAEEGIAQIWSEVLSLNKIDATTPFFKLGGSSLAAMDVMVRVCNRFSLKLPLQSLFDQPTVRQLASLVEETILDELSALDDEEVQALLNNEDAL